jgi:hypothetical protein
MANLTADKVLQKTFEHLEQMLDEKNRRDQKRRDEFQVVDPASEDAKYLKIIGERTERNH